MPSEQSLEAMFEWSIVVFARNEHLRIAEGLAAVARATRDVAAHVTVIVNGSADGTLEIARQALPTFTVPTALYAIAFGCKSHAINVFIHELRPRARFYIFLDATAFVAPDGLRRLIEGLAARPDCLAASGVPANGRSAAQMRRAVGSSPKLFGQMFAIRGEFADHLLRLGRKLPIGLYRCDGLFSGFICYETDGVAHEQPVPRILNVMEAQWKIRPLSWARPADIRAGCNRLVRQARGRLENQAWNPILWSQGFGALPRFADEMILDWLRTGRPKRQGLPQAVFTWLALRRIRRWRQPPEEALRPTRIA